MKTFLAGLVALTSTALAQVPNNPVPPPLNDVLMRANPHVVIFQPTSLAPGQSLNVSHVRVGDGSVKPGSAVQLVVYSKESDDQGNHAVLFHDFHQLRKEGSPVLNFEPYTMSAEAELDGRRQGIIAVLIGLLLPAQGPARPNALPPLDLISAEITDGTSIGLLLPAVQKVRSAAAR